MRERTVHDVKDAVVGVPNIHDVGVAEFAEIVGLAAGSRDRAEFDRESRPSAAPKPPVFSFDQRFATENLRGEIVLKRIVVIEPAGRHITASLAQRIRALFHHTARVGQRDCETR